MQFKDVIGQDAVKARLRASRKEGRISHAQLFFGPSGSGVLPMAMAYAQFLICQQPTDNDSCGTCPSCQKCNKMVHPDIYFSFPVITLAKQKIDKPVSNDFITDFRKMVLSHPYMDYNDWMSDISDTENKQGRIYVHEGPEIIKRINLKAFEAPFKIVLMWLPEKMWPDLANKLLKSLEEPPDNTVFLLASEQRDALLQTILSRTQSIKLTRLNDQQVINSLLLSKEMEMQKAGEIARLADGDYHLAEELSEQLSGNDTFDKSFLAWMRLCFNPAKNMEALMAWVDQIASYKREEQKQFLYASIQMVRECMMVNLADPSLVKLENQQVKTLEKFLPFVNAKNMTPFVEELSKAHYHIERNAHAKILFLDLSLKLGNILQIKA